MSHERPQPYRRPAEIFGLSRSEQLWYAVSEQRFQALLADDAVTIHKVEVSSNAFGEYVFVTLSKRDGIQQAVLTLYGLGYHEEREEWITERWYWHASNPMSHVMQSKISREEALQQIDARRYEIENERTDTTPSQRAMLFRLIADLTDEDGALAELEDLENLGFDVDDFGEW